MKEIQTDEVPASIGSSSRRTTASSTVYFSEQGLVDQQTRNVVGENVHKRTNRNLENREEVGRSLTAVKFTKLNKIKNYLNRINDVYGEYKLERYPGQIAVQAVELPINIDMGIGIVLVRVE